MRPRFLALLLALSWACGEALARAESAHELRREALAPSSGASVDARSETVRIRDIQGRAHISPLVGQRVTDVRGVVTHVARNGFVMQDAEPDADEATSEALFVFTRTKPAVKIGDLVAVSGRVSEYRPGCAPCSPSSSAYANLTSTQLDDQPTVHVLAQDVALPAPIVIGPSGRKAPSRIDAQAPGDIEGAGAQFAPHRDAIDFYESLEHMRVMVRDAVVVGPTKKFANGARVAVVVPENARDLLRNGRGVLPRSQHREHPARVFLDSPSLPELDVGDRFAGALTGTLGYSFGNFKLYPEGPLPTVVKAKLTREEHTLGIRDKDELSIASINLENLDPGDPPAKFATLAEAIVQRLGAPDLVSVEEVQDDNGPRKDATVTASITFSRLIAAITAAGGPMYEAHWIDPENGRDGGEPGGNIRVGLLVRTDRGLQLVKRGNADHASKNLVERGEHGPTLRYSPGRIAPANPAFRRSRKPLAAELTWKDTRLFVIACHFNSKTRDQPLFGRFQPPARPSDAQRTAQAEVVGAFVREILAQDPKAHVVVLGDLNDFEEASTLAPLRTAGLWPLVEALPAPERYSYVFDGIAQTLDHMFVSGSLRGALSGFDVVHMNAEFAEQASDHDPIVARFRLPRAAR